MKYTILGAGLSGISASFHLGHDNCEIFEKNSYAGGHIYSEYLDGFTWDEGPHVSFTKHEYVRELFAKNTKGEYLEFPISTSNYYEGNWIPHPAQSNLWAIPMPLRDKCLQDFLKTRGRIDNEHTNYGEWLRLAFGDTFAENFPQAYTEKYWTTHPKNLTTDWVGDRVFYPKVSDVEQGYISPLPQQTHYITHIRYPKKAGYFSFARALYDGANLHFNKEVIGIDFESQKITFSDGSIHRYDKLINTLPLPILIERSSAPIAVKEAAKALRCSSVLLVNVTAIHATARKENWMYVYDKDKLSTRINCTELLSPNNAPTGKTGVQVEVYFSSYRPKLETDEQIAQQVCNELIEMGLIQHKIDIESCHTRWIQWANVIFDHSRRDAQAVVLDYLKQYGLRYEEDELEPMTDWNNKKNLNPGKIILAGRFAQWKYFWTDDCVLRGKLIADSIK